MTFLLELQNKLFYQEYWRIGYCYYDNDLTDFKVDNKCEWLNVDDIDYEADPFVFKIDGKHYIAYEAFDYLKGNAKLRCVDLNGMKYDFFDEVNSSYGHKSYPFIFTHEHETYCIPEESDRNGLFLYKFNTETKRFTFIHQILNDGNYIDSSILYLNNLFYILTSTSDEPYKQRLFYSPGLLNTFIEHQSSPIIESKKYGRNGGLINYNGSYFRISQNCSRYYGENLELNLIDQISESRYSEQSTVSIHAGNNFDHGIHTLSYCDGVIVFDSKKRVFKLSNLFRKAINKILKKIGIEYM